MKPFPILHQVGGSEMASEPNPVEETYSHQAPVCPWCSYEHQHDGGFFYDESLAHFECESCGKGIFVLVYTSTTWTCRPDTTEPSP